MSADQLSPQQQEYLQLQAEVARITELVHKTWNETNQTEKALGQVHLAISLALRTGETLDAAGLYEPARANVQWRLKQERKALKKALVALRNLSP